MTKKIKEVVEKIKEKVKKEKKEIKRVRGRQLIFTPTLKSQEQVNS